MSNTARSDFMLAGKVPLRAVRAYLSANGWFREQSRCRAAADIYLRQAGDLEFAIVPTSDRYADYATRIYQLAEQVGRIEQRPLAAVLADLSTAESDRVRLRILTDGGDNTVGLAQAGALLAESKRLLAAAASAAEAPKPTYPPKKTRRVSDYLNRVRMGHTEQGSFIINILAPASGTTEQLDLPLGEDAPEPFERKVTRKLASALCASRRAADQLVGGGPKITSTEEWLEEGLSSNLCRSVAKLAEEGHGLEVAVTLASTHSSESERDGAPVTFTPSDSDALNEVASMLEDLPERPRERIQGYVSKLSREKADRKGKVTIKAPVAGKPASIHGEFEPDDYSRITRAHDQRLPVALEGDLLKDAGQWHIRNILEVNVTEDEDASRSASRRAEPPSAELSLFDRPAAGTLTDPGQEAPTGKDPDPSP